MNDDELIEWLVNELNKEDVKQKVKLQGLEHQREWIEGRPSDYFHYQRRPVQVPFDAGRPRQQEINGGRPDENPLLPEIRNLYIQELKRKALKPDMVQSVNDYIPKGFTY